HAHVELYSKSIAILVTLSLFYSVAAVSYKCCGFATGFPASRLRGPKTQQLAPGSVREFLSGRRGILRRQPRLSPDQSAASGLRRSTAGCFPSYSSSTKRARRVSTAFWLI